jgi:hypothetical protein
MNALLWILQVVLALHTATGAAWKLSHSPAQTMPAFAPIPGGVWSGMAVVELLCALALLAPVFRRRMGRFVPVAAAYVAAEMVLFSVLQLRAGSGDAGSLVYWLVVALVCAFVAWGRRAGRPLVAA